ncbi:hypothetical protein DPMN_007289 [Dreissena polymorpha]|uniref:Uncharacterized protein n=1 Tax=Dreissena polymorpha TaxID=45954 RepID=A0A9D4RWA2_DREPO|nr:hypothetical protein DPMN_007289 [Dreissena polymorpha]
MVHKTDIIKPNFTTQDTNVLTKFHEDWATELNKTRVLTRFNYSHIRKNAPPYWNSLLTRKNSPPLVAMFLKQQQLIQDIIGTNLQINGHAFLPIRTIFELNCHIQKTHVLTKFHEHWTKKSDF